MEILIMVNGKMTLDMVMANSHTKMVVRMKER